MMIMYKNNDEWMKISMMLKDNDDDDYLLI